MSRATITQRGPPQMPVEQEVARAGIRRRVRMHHKWFDEADRAD